MLKGNGWRLVYAAGGNTQHPELGDRYTSSEFVEHWRTNPPVIIGPHDGIPSDLANGANDNLEREGKRHWGDLTIGEVDSATGLLVSKAVEELAAITKGKISVGFCLHRLNSLQDDYGVVVYFPDLPAVDRNANNSPRVSVQFAESIRSFATNPSGVARRAEQSSIDMGFVIEPVFPHSGPVLEMLAANRARQAKPSSAPGSPGLPPVTVA